MCVNELLIIFYNDFEIKLILTIEIKTSNPVEDYFGSGFPAICNHYGVMAA